MLESLNAFGIEDLSAEDRHEVLTFELNEIRWCYINSPPLLPWGAMSREGRVAS